MMTSFLRAGLLRVVEFSESSQEGLTVRKGAKLSLNLCMMTLEEKLLS